MDKSLDDTDVNSVKSDDEDQDYSSDVEKTNVDTNDPNEDMLSDNEGVDSDVGSDVESETDLVTELEADGESTAEGVTQPATSVQSMGNNTGVNINPNYETDIPAELVNTQEEDMFIINDDNDEDDTISENYEEYIQKINKEYTKDILENYHKEEYHINHDEMLKLSQLKRNDKGFIDDPLHKTTPILSKYEYTSIVGIRAKQLADGAQPLTEIPEELIDNYIVAEIELKQKVLPFIIKRPLGHGGCEYWRISDLEILL